MMFDVDRYLSIPLLTGCRVRRLFYKDDYHQLCKLFHNLYDDAFYSEQAIKKKTSSSLRDDTVSERK